MKIRDMISMSVSSLLKRKVRTLLTVAGVVIGTCAIVVMLSFGLGLKESMNAMVEGMGDLTMIQIYGNYGGGGTDDAVLDDASVEKIKKLEGISAVSPLDNLDPSMVTIRSGKYAYSGMIYGVDFTALKEFGYTLESGKFPGANFDKGTVLFGKSALYQFYNTKKTTNNMVYPEPDSSGKIPDPYVDPMKDKLELVINERSDDGQEPTVSSKQKPQKLECVALMTDDFSKNPPPGYSVFLDIHYTKQLKEAYNKLNKVKADANSKKGYETVSVKVKSIEDVPAVEEAIHTLGFTNTNSMESIRKPLEEQMRTIQLILGGLGAISLLVAALGITNTMVMSIYERTREIGVMKVLGCIVGNIRSMFLIEAGVIGFMGGVAGLLLSYGISFAVNSFAGQFLGSIFPVAGGGAAGASISVIPLWLALGALLFATMVGLAAGFYPANRAVKISALSAIRQE